MAHWFDPASPAVRSVLTGVMLVSLLGRDQPQLSALALSAMVAALLSALALWELRAPAHSGLLRHLQHQQQEGTT